MKHHSWALLASVLLACAAPAAADEKQIMGMVVNEKGQPVAGVELAIGWKCVGDNKLEPEQKLKSDRTGRFVGKIPCEDAAVALVAYDKDRKRAALAVIEPGDLNKSVRLQLGPAVEVTADFELGRFAKPPKTFKVEITVLPKGIRVQTAETPKTKFSTVLPPADYHIAVAAEGAEPAEADFDIREATGKFTIDAIEIEPTDTNAAPPPLPQLSLTEARGVDKKVQLSDFKGKWVLLEIWGHW